MRGIAMRGREFSTPSKAKAPSRLRALPSGRRAAIRAANFRRGSPGPSDAFERQIVPSDDARRGLKRLSPTGTIIKERPEHQSTVGALRTKPDVPELCEISGLSRAVALARTTRRHPFKSVHAPKMAGERFSIVSPALG